MDGFPTTRSPPATLVTAAAEFAEVQALAAGFPVQIVAIEDLLREVVQTGEHGQPVCVERSADVLGAVTATPDAAERLDAHQDALSLMAGPAGFEHFRVDQQGASEFGPWLCRRVAALGATYFRDAARLRRANAVLRREHDDALDRFFQIELDYGRSVPAPALKLSYPPTTARTRVASLVQRLPISPLGVAIVELKLDEVGAKGPGVLHVELFTEGPPRPSQVWAIGAEDLKPGWIGLRLERTLTTTAMGARLEIHWEGEAATAPALALSDRIPLDEYAAATPGEDGALRPLALRIWGLPPGVRVPAAGAAAGDAEVAGNEQLMQFGLSAKELSRSELIAPIGLDLGFSLVAFRPEMGDVLVHPNVAGPTVALVRDIPVANAKSIRALVSVDHEKSLPVEFGLALAPSRPVHLDPIGLIKSWTRVDHSIYSEVIGDIHPSDALCDLIMATRMADGADSNLAWAFFKKVEVFA